VLLWNPDQMHLLFLDCETSGLPLNRYAAFTATEMWPRLVQLSWQVVDSESWETIENHDYFVKSDLPWNSDAERIHRIPENIVTRFGLDPLKVLTDLAASIGVSDKIICHNLAFDKNVILAEAQRLYESGKTTVKPREMWNRPDFCTMLSTKVYCNIKFKDGNGLKFPKLEELYTRLFNKAYDISGADLHNSANDVSCLVTCVKELIGRGELATLLQK
jgi:DNA polymerase III epsilon subunit-like protein